MRECCTREATVCSFRKGVGKDLLRRRLSQDLKEMRDPRMLTAEGRAFWAGETADVEACRGVEACCLHEE